MAKQATEEKFIKLRRQAIDDLVRYDKTNPDEFAGGIQRLIVALDTDRRDLEQQNEALRLAQAKLEESHLRLDHLYQFAPVGYLRLNRTGLIIEANLRAADMLKLDKTELVKRDFLSFVLLPDRDIFNLHQQNLLNYRKRQSCSLRLEDNDGSLLHVQLESDISSHGQDPQESIMMTLTDITELALTRKNREELNEELDVRVQQRTLSLQHAQSQLLHREKLAAIGALAASIAHELNNPLQGVLNVINGIGRRATFDPEDAELLKIAVDECKRMRDLLKALQDFNRPTSGIRAPLEVHSMIDSVLLLFRKEFSKRDILVEKQYGQNIPILYGVADQIKQVIMNLLSNAVSACGGGGRIIIGTVTDQLSITISIEDNGIGIDPDIKKHIFEPFFSTKPDVKGTGLGLSVSYGIIEKHNGSIKVDSRQGEGSLFRIKLPIRGTERS